MIDHVQEACNACARHTLNNVGMAGGPMVEINEDRCPGGGDPAPLRVWRVTNDQMGSDAPAIRVYNITFVADKLMDIFDKFARLADDHSGVPAYAHGDPEVGGAGNTASGLSMLMTTAARGIKGVIKTMDEKLIEPTVERQYYLNIEKVENAALVADFKTKATGSSSLIAKEQQAVRRAEFMKTTQNQIDYGIMGPDGRKYLLKDTARALELDADKVVPEAPPQPPPVGAGLTAESRTAPAPGQPQDFRPRRRTGRRAGFPALQPGRRSRSQWLKPARSNPLLNPADQVLKAAIAISADSNFDLILSWISACYAAVVHRLPTRKDETELRWMQGQAQALLLINKALSSPRETLLAREEKAKENATPRNL